MTLLINQDPEFELLREQHADWYVANVLDKYADASAAAYMLHRIRCRWLAAPFAPSPTKCPKFVGTFAEMMLRWPNLPRCTKCM